MFLTMEIKNQIDRIWDDMFSYGIANPLVVIEQLTYLFFIKSLDMIETKNEDNANALGAPFTERIFPEDEHSQSLRWSQFKDLSADQIFSLLPSRVFPSLHQRRKHNRNLIGWHKAHHQRNECGEKDGICQVYEKRHVLSAQRPYN